MKLRQKSNCVGSRNSQFVLLVPTTYSEKGLYFEWKRKVKLVKMRFSKISLFRSTRNAEKVCLFLHL